MKQIIQLFVETVSDIYDQKVEVELSRPDAQFGDLSTNVALKLAKSLGQSPRDVAQKIVDHLSEKSDLINQLDIAGPGFINIWLTDKVLLSNLVEPEKDSLDNPMKGKKVLVEYSDPNPFKPLHAGHLYTTLVGDVIARLVEQSGAEVIRLNYGGDVGPHVAKTMWAIFQEFGGEKPEQLAKIKPEDRSGWLGDRYVQGNNAYEEDETSKEQILAINKRVYELHSKDDKTSDFAKIYWECRGWSYDYLKQLYEQLEVKPFDRFIPESEVFQIGLDTVRSQLAKGVYEESDGAVVYKGEDKGLHTRVFINSQGLPTYETKDVGLIQVKWRDYHFDRSIMITASEQSQYMQVVLASIAEYEPEIVSRTEHLTHGVVKLAGGVKMSSRKGNIVSAIDIINSANQEASKQPNAVSQETVLAAIKYAFAKNKIGGDIVYSPEESIALEGNSGPYLQYAHARAAAILRKANVTSADLEQKLSADTDQELDKAERSLVLALGQYRGVLANATAELAPHLITNYIYELAQEFNRFYENAKVIGSDRQDFRLALVSKYAQTLKDGLSILGISAPDEM